MWDKVILKNKIYIKNSKVKNGNFTIPCIFKEFKKNEIINVILNSGFKEIFNNQIGINGNIDCFIIIPEFVFNYFSKKI